MIQLSFGQPVDRIAKPRRGLYDLSYERGAHDWIITWRCLELADRIPWIAHKGSILLLPA